MSLSDPSNPTFVDLTATGTPMQGALVMFNQDAFNPRDGVLVSSTHAYQISDYSKPGLVDLDNEYAFRFTTDLRSLQSERGVPGFFACISYRRATAGGSVTDVDVTTDSGVTWTNYTPSQFGSWVGGSGDGVYNGCYVSAGVPGKIISSGYTGAGVATGRLMVSLDYGATWSALNGNTFYDKAGDIHIPLQNTAENIIYHGGGDVSLGATHRFRLYKTVNGVQTDISPIVSGNYYGARYPFSVKTCDSDPRKVLLVGVGQSDTAYGAFLSLDAGATWRVLVAPDVTSKVRAGTITSDGTIFLWGEATLLVSYDGGNTLLDKSVGLIAGGAGRGANIAGVSA